MLFKEGNFGYQGKIPNKRVSNQIKFTSFYKILQKKRQYLTTTKNSK